MGVNGVSTRESRANSRSRTMIRVAAAVTFMAVLLVFAGAASGVEYFPGDRAATSWVQSLRTSWLDNAMEAVSFLGVELVAVALVALAVLALYLKRLRWEAGLILGATVVAYALRIALKFVVARPRPSEDLVSVVQQTDGYGFPSGHAMHYAVFLGAIAFVLLKDTGSSPGRWVVLGAMLALLVAVGFSRIYLGVHWTSGVLGGYAFGGGVILGAIWLWRRLRKTSDRAATDGKEP